MNFAFFEFFVFKKNYYFALFFNLTGRKSGKFEREFCRIEKNMYLRAKI